MGCDIHLYVEFKDSNGRWLLCEPEFTSTMYDEDDEYFGSDRFKNTSSPYDGRNYTLFSYLADVRNGYGFAGVDTGDKIMPISMPRGLPEDVSGCVSDESYKWGVDGHSHSWFTLGELKDAMQKAKETNIIKRGYVTAEEYQQYLENGSPESWCGGVSGRSVRKVSNQEMERLIEGDDTESVYTQIEWSTSLYDYTKTFWDHVIPQLDDYGYEDHKDNEIRIVFWFDN